MSSKKKGKRGNKKKATSRMDRGKGSVLQANRRTQAQGPKRDFKHAIRVTGREVFYNVNNQTAYLPSEEVNARGLASTKLLKYFDIYEKWFVHRLRFEYEPLVNKTVSGAVHMCFDHDANDLLPDYTEMPANMSKQVEYSTGPACERVNMDVENPFVCGVPVTSHLFCDPIETKRISTFGRLITGTQGVPTGTIALDAQVGTMYIVYDITFSMPQWLSRVGEFENGPDETFTIMNGPLVQNICTMVGDIAGERVDTSVAKNAAKLCTGILKSATGAVTLANRDQLLKFGQRMWWRNMTQTLERATPKLEQAGTNLGLGMLSLDPKGDYPVMVSGNDADTFVITDVEIR